MPTIALAGATGDLGTRIHQALLARGATVRPVGRSDFADVQSVAAAVQGATCVVSALNGTRPVIVDRQGLLLDGAVEAGVPRFIPSDFAADFTKTVPGENRNFDLRREFMARADRAPIAVTSVLNGAFMDMLGAEMPLIQTRIHRVLYWSNADQPLDFTTKNNVAAYTAAAALDSATPRFLRIAGETLTARQLAEAMTDVTGERYRTQWAGTLMTLGLMIRIGKLVAPQPDTPFPPWQGMQYTRDMFSGRAALHPLDNARYPDMEWTSVRQHLASRFGTAA